MSILLIGCLAHGYSLWGQCPVKDSLWQQLTVIKTASPGSPEKLLPLLLKYEADFRACPDRFDSTHAFLLTKIGLLYFRLADYLKAQKYFIGSIDMIKKNAGKRSTSIRGLIENYYRLSEVYNGLNRVADRMSALDSCATVALHLKIIDLFCLKAIYVRAEYFYDVGDFQRCVTYAAMCESLARDYASSGAANASLDAASYISSSLGWHVNALLSLKKYEEAQNLLLNEIRESKLKRLKNNLVVLYEQLAEVQVSLGNFSKALSYFNSAYEYATQLGNGTNCKTILNNIGFLVYFDHFKDDKRALSYFKRALQFTNRDRSWDKLDSLESLNTLTSIANLFARIGRYDSAHAYFQLAFDHLRPGAKESDVIRTALGDNSIAEKSQYISELLIDKADAYYLEYKTTRSIKALQESIRIYKIADQFLCRIRTRQFSVESKLFWRNDTHRLYDHAVEACFAIDDFSNGFYFCEQSRAALLKDQLNEQRWIGEQDILKQTQLRSRVLQLEARLNTLDRNSDAFNAIQAEVFTARQEIDHLASQIRTANPLYYRTFLDSVVISPADVRRTVLKDYDAFVEIFAGDSSVFNLVITKDGIQWTRVKRALFDTLAREYFSYLSSASDLNAHFDSFVHISNSLWRLIFQDIQVPRGRVIISPDGNYFPFEALVTGNGRHPIRYFVEDCAVSYAYSAGYLLSDGASTQIATSKSFMGLAPVNYPREMNLPPLGGSDLSLKKIGAYFYDGLSVTQEKASRGNFLKNFSNFRIIQLYAHGSDTSSRGEPVIYFADSALYLSELSAESKPTASLIVLSACHTGSGKFYLGEGVFSFSRGFAALGVPCSISNLWAVDNQSTYRLTELFYKNLAAGLSTDIALQRAKLEFIQSGPREASLPSYWAAAIVIGRNESFDVNRHFPWVTIIGIVVILASATSLMLMKRTNHTSVLTTAQ